MTPSYHDVVVGFETLLEKRMSLLEALADQRRKIAWHLDRSWKAVPAGQIGGLQVGPVLATAGVETEKAVALEDLEAATTALEGAAGCLESARAFGLLEPAADHLSLTKFAASEAASWKLTFAPALSNARDEILSGRHDRGKAGLELIARMLRDFLEIETRLRTEIAKAQEHRLQLKAQLSDFAKSGSKARSTARWTQLQAIGGSILGIIAGTLLGGIGGCTVGGVSGGIAADSTFNEGANRGGNVGSWIGLVVGGLIGYFGIWGEKGSSSARAGREARQAAARVGTLLDGLSEEIARMKRALAEVEAACAAASLRESLSNAAGVG